MCGSYSTPPQNSTDMSGVGVFGRRVAYALHRNETSWLALTHAALYWRIRGNSLNVRMV